MEQLGNQSLANQFKDPAGSKVGQGLSDPGQSVSRDFGQPQINKTPQLGAGVEIKPKNTIGFRPKGAIV